MIVTVVKTALATQVGGAGFGALAVGLLILFLMSKEVLAHVGEGRWLSLRRALDITLLPLVVVAGIALIQQVMGL